MVFILCCGAPFNLVNTTVITMPPSLKKRGRPKGHELTSIGLPAKKAKKGQKEIKPRVVPLIL